MCERVCWSWWLELDMRWWNQWLGLRKPNNEKKERKASTKLATINSYAITRVESCNSNAMIKSLIHWFTRYSKHTCVSCMDLGLCVVIFCAVVCRNEAGAEHPHTIWGFQLALCNVTIHFYFIFIFEICVLRFWAQGFARMQPHSNSLYHFRFSDLLQKHLLLFFLLLTDCRRQIQSSPYGFQLYDDQIPRCNGSNQQTQCAIWLCSANIPPIHRTTHRMYTNVVYNAHFPSSDLPMACWNRSCDPLINM